MVGRKIALRAQAHALNLEASDSDSGDGGNESDKDDQKCQKTKGASICNINLTNRNLGNIVNGFPGDAIEDRPFD